MSAKVRAADPVAGDATALYPCRPDTPLDTCSLSTHVRDASNFAGFPDRGVAAVVCNGVTMYFPSASYLVEVLANGLPKLRTTPERGAPPGRAPGIYHVGDVISMQHIELFVLRQVARAHSRLRRRFHTAHRAARGSHADRRRPTSGAPRWRALLRVAAASGGAP